MFIDEIPVRSKIAIEFHHSSQSTDLETTVKRIGQPVKGGRSIITDAVRINGKVVNINNFKGNINISYTKQGAKRCNVWKFVQVKYDRDRKEYIIISPKDSEKQERRLSPRIPIGLGATVQISGDARKHNCTLYDLSKTGMGIRMEVLESKAIGKTFEVSFADKSELTSFTVTGRCVREVENDSRIRLYGCAIKPTPDLLAYIQRKKIKYENTLRASGR